MEGGIEFLWSIPLVMNQNDGGGLRWVGTKVYMGAILACMGSQTRANYCHIRDN